jgi:flagellar biogenesis protein FliO
MDMNSFSFIGTIILIAVVILIVYAVNKFFKSKRELKQENQKLKKEINEYKNL